MSKLFMLFVAIFGFGTTEPATQPGEVDQSSQPLMLTVHVASAHPTVALDLISKQADRTIHVWPENLWTGNNYGPVPQITMDTDSVPFWTTLAQFSTAAHVHPQVIGNFNGITLVQGDSDGSFGGRMDDRGQFAVVVTSINHTRNASVVSGDINRDDRVQMTVFADPQVGALHYGNEVQVETAEDESGKSLAKPNPDKNRIDGQSWNGPNWMFEVSAPLNFQTNAGKKLAKFKGAVRVQIPSKVATIQFDDMVKAVGTKATGGPYTVEVKNFKIDNDQTATVNIVITSARTRNNNNNNLFQMVRDIQFRDADNQEINSQSMGGGGGNQHFEWNMRIESQSAHLQSGKPIKLVWTVATELKIIDVPFSFVDLPLPQE